MAAAARSDGGASRYSRIYIYIYITHTHTHTVGGLGGAHAGRWRIGRWANGQCGVERRRQSEVRRNVRIYYYVYMHIRTHTRAHTYTCIYIYTYANSLWVCGCAGASVCVDEQKAGGGGGQSLRLSRHLSICSRGRPATAAVHPVFLTPLY